jgi:tetratricopeptide (TPR) repeat protein
MPAASRLFVQALESARRGGNHLLEPLLLMNLGVAQVRLGNRAEAAAYYQASSERYEALGDQLRAAQQQANSAALRIEYAEEPSAALRDAQNALAVFQKLGEKNFEAFCLQVIALYYRQTGRHVDADRELNRALSILRERNLDDDIASVTIDRARSHIEAGHYAMAANLLEEASRITRSPVAAAARLHKARLYSRMGDASSANRELAAAAAAAAAEPDLLPLVHLTTGELAYEAGDVDAARQAFLRAAALWTPMLPDTATVEARAWLGFLDGTGPRPSVGREQVEASLAQAERMERPALAALSRVFLAQIALREGRAADALRVLGEVPPDDATRTIGPELRAQVHYWRSVAHAAEGDRGAAAGAASEARTIVDRLRAELPDQRRAAFAARADIRRIIG